jgi:hypothetical protein
VVFTLISEFEKSKADGKLWLTNSQIETYQRCRRQHWWEYVHRLVPNELPNPLKASELGTRVHKFCERYYSGEKSSDLIEELQSSIDAIANVTPDSDAHKAAIIVLSVFEGYIDWLADTGADQGIGVIAAESVHTRTMPEFPDVIFAGTIDLETEESIVDLKTCKVPFNTKIKTLRRSRQLVGYAWLLEPKRYVNQMKFRIMKQSTRSERTEGPYYTEETLPITRARLRNHEVHLRELVPQIQEQYTRTTLPAPTPAEHCSWICPFYLVCDAADQGEDYEQLIKDDFHQGDPDERYHEDPE